MLKWKPKELQLNILNLFLNLSVYILLFFNSCFFVFFNKTFNTNLQSTDQVGYSKFRHMAFFPSTVLVKAPVFFLSTVQFKEGLRLPVPLAGFNTQAIWFAYFYMLNSQKSE